MVSILLFISLLAVAAPSQAKADGTGIHGVPIPGAKEVPLFWDTQAFPDGPTLRLNGTIQEMHKQLLAINPNYDTDFERATVVEKRTNFENAQLECRRDDWGDVEAKGYGEGIEFLRKHSGIPHMGPGPGACSRVSCSWNTGMWMCNDTPAHKFLISFGSVADGAEHIWKACEYTRRLAVGGQVFHPTGWNVILSHQSC